jgi:aryl-alcohol dehydrogenase
MRDQAYPVPQPIVLGHESAGVVEASGSAVSTLQTSDHVVLSYDFCLFCESCLDRYPMHCREVTRRSAASLRTAYG